MNKAAYFSFDEYPRALMACAGVPRNFATRIAICEVLRVIGLVEHDVVRSFSDFREAPKNDGIIQFHRRVARLDQRYDWHQAFSSAILPSREAEGKTP